jgi:hypothetical protein
MRRTEEIEVLERRFPATAAGAFAEARVQALAAGLSVLETRDAMIWEVYPDGTRLPIKAIEPPTAVVRGSIFRIS